MDDRKDRLRNIETEMGWTHDKTRQLYEAAADWWVERLNPKKFDNGEPFHNALAEAAAESADTVTPGQKAIFRQSIIDQLEVMAIDPYYGRSIRVDYDPDDILSAALKEAGIDPFMALPWKTAISISRREVRGAEGYGAKWDLIFPAKAEEAP